MTKLALAKTGDQKYQNEVLSQLDAEDLNLRYEAISKLAYIGDSKYVPNIAEFLYDSNTQSRFLAASALSALVENPPVKVDFPELYTDEDIVLWLNWWETNQNQYR